VFDHKETWNEVVGQRVVHVRFNPIGRHGAACLLAVWTWLLDLGCGDAPATDLEKRYRAALDELPAKSPKKVRSATVTAMRKRDELRP